MEFCTRAKKCVSRNNYGLLGRVGHEMHLALKRETGAFGREGGSSRLRSRRSKEEQWQTPLKGSRASEIGERFTHSFSEHSSGDLLVKSTPVSIGRIHSHLSAV